MSFEFKLRSFLEILAVLALIYGYIKSDKLVDFEYRVWDEYNRLKENKK